MNRRAILAVVTVVGVGFVALAFLGESIMRRAESMQTADTAGTFDAAKPGDTVKLVVRVTSVQPRTLEATLLTRQTESVYAAMATNLRAQWSPAAKFVMGAETDLKPGSIVDVIGSVNGDRSVAARELVILSGYVRVAP
jgi:hypothetical protein